MIEELELHIDEMTLGKLRERTKDSTLSFADFINSFDNSEDINQLFVPPSASSSKDSSPSSKNPSGGSSSQDVIAICRCFWLSDENCDGMLDRKEFSRMTEALGMKLNKNAVDRAFGIADVDKNGKITFSEFIAAYLSRSAYMFDEKHLKEVFLKGSEGSGSLTRDECSKVLKTLGNESSKYRLERFLNRMDMNGDGLISLGEFCKFLDLNCNK